jgi:hypothetical protein
MSPREASEELYWNGAVDTIAFTEGVGDFPNHTPPEIESLVGTELSYALVCVMKLRDMSGHIVGFGSELEIRPDPTVSRDPIDCYYTIVLPGRGTFLLYQMKKNRKASYVSNKAVTTDEKIELFPTCGPGEGGDRSVIIGGTGEFEGVTGSHYQIMQINFYGPSEGRCLEHFDFVFPS